MDNDIVLKTDRLDGKDIAYSSQTTFLVQVGRGRDSYSTRYVFTGDLRAAVTYYNGINLGPGFKKRLLMPASKKPVLAKAVG